MVKNSWSNPPEKSDEPERSPLEVFDLLRPSEGRYEDTKSDDRPYFTPHRPAVSDDGLIIGYFDIGNFEHIAAPNPKYVRTENLSFGTTLCILGAGFLCGVFAREVIDFIGGLF